VKIYPSRACPVCGGEDRRLVFRQAFAAVDASTPVTGYDVVVCGGCGAAYADGIPTQDAFDQYYRDMSKYEYAQRAGEESQYDRRRLELIAGIIAPRIPSTQARVLDVGCASGRLLANIRDLGFPNVVGLDPSPACAAAADRLYGIEVRTMTLAEIAASGEQFDVVIMVGVLEHLEDLDRAFAQLRQLITPGGLLYIEVPDVTTFADWPNAPFQDFSTEHINFFSPVSIRNVMRRHGFSQVFLEQNHRIQSFRTVMSNISAFFRNESLIDQALEFDTTSASGLERYVADCVDADRTLRRRIDEVVDAKRPILVWGVGTHTSRLMATSRLADAEIVAFIESNARYHGKSLHGRPIVAPETLRERGEPVLVSSRVFQNEIANQIRDELKCANELILLYDF
jgi:SAM-dependent methyltransferase